MGILEFCLIILKLGYILFYKKVTGDNGHLLLYKGFRHRYINPSPSKRKFVQIAV
jgi:hypothetical protein